MAVIEHECPLDGVFWKCAWDLELHDLGLVDHFDPIGADAAPCLPSQHLYARMLHRDADGKLHFHPELEMPRIHDCPATREGIKARLRAKGPGGIPVLAHAWLTLMLPEHELQVMGVGAGVTPAHLKALDAIRVKRDPSQRSNRANYERALQARSDAHAAKRLAQRLKG
jgi:hypothetical protein